MLPRQTELAEAGSFDRKYLRLSLRDLVDREWLAFASGHAGGPLGGVALTISTLDRERIGVVATRPGCSRLELAGRSAFAKQVAGVSKARAPAACKGASADACLPRPGIQMLALIRASGRVVTRDEMLAQVWRTPFASSNKIEAVVRSLRKKLGAFAPSIETVTGHGYRFSGWKRGAPRREDSRVDRTWPINPSGGKRKPSFQTRDSAILLCMTIGHRSWLLLFAVVAMSWSAARASVPARAAEDWSIAGLQAVAHSATTPLKTCNHRCNLRGLCMPGCAASCHAVSALIPFAAIVTIVASAVEEAMTPRLEEHRWRPDPPPPKPSTIT